MHLLLSPLASLVPQPWRRALAVTTFASGISGIAEFLFCLIALGYRYFTFMHLPTFADTNIMVKAARQHGEAVVMGSGLLLSIEYLLHPLTIVLGYFAAEGLVRAIAASITHEVVPSFPFYLLFVVHERWLRVHRERAMGERIVDDVRFYESSPCCLRIASCRPKETWNRLTTIAYQDQMYELAAAQEGNPPRPFVYLLRKKPEHKIIRGIHYYDPEETLEQKRGDD
jgi:hypothetical protein